MLRETSALLPIDERACEFAKLAHREQVYGGGSFFELHLSRVVATLRRFGETDRVLLAAGWLHDVLEDTPTAPHTILQEFGPEVADLVVRLTDEKGGTRRERHGKTHAKIRGNTHAVRVKLADRIANVEQSVETDSPLMEMYRKEYRRFRTDLYLPDEYEAMWNCLDQLLLDDE